MPVAADRKVLHRQAGHLAEVGHRRLAGIGLPVGVGDEGDRRVEGQEGRHRGEALRVQRQHVLQAQDHVEQREAARVEGQHGEQVALPALARGIHARGAQQRAVEFGEEAEAPLRDGGEPSPNGHRRDHGDAQHERDLRPADEGHVQRLSGRSRAQRR
jgi:hypothetical protein